MDEQQLYIENCILGLWENENYSFTFQDGTPKSLAITDKINAPRTGTDYTYHIVKQDFYYLLRVIITDGNSAAAIDYKIVNIDCATGELIISTDGATWELKKISQY
jgi:hypothetical protein